MLLIMREGKSILMRWRSELLKLEPKEFLAFL